MSRVRILLSIAAVFIAAGGALMVVNSILGGCFIIAGFIVAFIAWRGQPIISVSIQQNDLTNRLYADVTNKGAGGIFEAQIRIIESSDTLLEAHQGIYQGYWEENKKGEISIPNGFTKRLQIAEYFSHPNSTSGYLRIYSGRFNPVGYHQLSHGYNILKKDLLTIPKVYLLLTITSSPKSLKGDWNAALRIRADNDYEVEYKVGKKKRKEIIEKGVNQTQYHRLLNKASQPPKDKPSKSD